MLRAKAHIRIGGQMADQVRAAHGLGQALHVEQVTLLQAKVWRLLRRPQELRLASSEIIVACDLVTIL
jgi:hypothetical protein